MALMVERIVDGGVHAEEALKVAYGCTASVLALRYYNGLRVPLFELNRAPHILAQGAKR
jgi:hypothetical protein